MTIRMQNNKERKLAAAKAKREKMLAQYVESVSACNCMWPIVNLRNLTGHDKDCPAHKILLQRGESASDD